MLLQLANVDVVYKGVIQVLRSTNLEVHDGSIVALLGANGAGKTTTLKAISGLLDIEDGRVTSGSIVFAGQDITNGDPGVVVESGVVQVLEGRRVLAHLTVAQNLRVGAHLRPDADVAAEIARLLDYFPRLKPLMERTAGYLSGGEMQMLLVGRALMAKPRLLLLDEPSMGLAPSIVRDVFAVIQRINREEGVTILLVEQNAAAAMGVCDYGYVMESGRIVLHGDRNRLMADADIREFYLGFAGGEGRRNFREVKHYKRRKRWLG